MSSARSKTSKDNESVGPSSAYAARNISPSENSRRTGIVPPALDQVLEQLQREQKRDARRVVIGFVVMLLSIAFVVTVVLARVLYQDRQADQRPPAPPPPARARLGVGRSLPENDSGQEERDEARFINALLGNGTFRR